MFGDALWSLEGRKPVVSSQSVVPNLFGTRDCFHGGWFFHWLGWSMVSGWFGHVTFIVAVQLFSGICLFVTPPGLQHTRLPCPSLSPRVWPNSCPLSRWCNLTISSSATLFSYCLQTFPTSGKIFQWVDSLHLVVKVLQLQLQHQSFQWIFSVAFL